MTTTDHTNAAWPPAAGSILYGLPGTTEPSTDHAADVVLPDVPGMVKPGTCWVLRHELKRTPSSYYEYDGSVHFPTWEQANAAVTIDPDDPSESHDLLTEEECNEYECRRKRRIAEVAYREHQHRLEVDAANLDQARQEADADHRERLLQVLVNTAAADRAHRQQVQLETAEYRESYLQLLVDAADYRDHQDQVRADEAADQAATAGAWRLVDVARTEIGKADAKAGLVVTLELALAGAIGSGVLGIAGILRWATIVALLTGILAAAWAVLPRPPRRTSRTPGEGDERLDYGAVRGLDGGQLAARLRVVDELESVSTEAVALARITHAKFTLIRWAMLAGAAGLVLAAIATATGAAR
ncbi:MAG TPA: Pycsar system effector family protein [Actinocatenispora sp.]|nr:Pycsar system effector family protein [Kribbella sp.]